jgi:hypothetical protein
MPDNPSAFCPVTPLAAPVACCKNCASTNTRQGPGAGPHFARLLCGDCGQFIKWLARPQHSEAAGAEAAQRTSGQNCLDL